MTKIAFIGAGSLQFTSKVVKDLMTFPAFDGAEIRLMDISEYRLREIGKVCDRLREAMGSHFTFVPTTDRRAALNGADAVICTVFNGDVDVWRHEIEIPMRYGVDMNIGDTRSVAGIFRALRNIPLMLDICRDIREICPNAVFLNYTNPMAMLCKAMQSRTQVDVTGLCHSVQGTSTMLAGWAGVDVEDPEAMKKFRYVCVGVNHQAFFTELTYDGKDLYPILREKMNDPVIWKQEKVRNEIFRTFGYYVTESSGHNSEYCAWFRKRPDLIEKYCDPDGAGWNPGEHAMSLKNRLKPDWFEKGVAEWFSKPVDKKRGQEYAAYILNARIGDGTPFPFNANLLNNGTVENLPYDACVEIPVIASPAGYERTFRGRMPSGPAALVSYTASIENLAVEAALEKSREKVVQAVSLDPLCSAVLSLEEIRNMCGEIFEKNRDYLGDYT